MDLELYDNRIFSIAVITTDDNGRDSLEIFTGKSFRDGQFLRFEPGDDAESFLLPPEYIPEIESVRDELKEKMNYAEFMLTLWVRPEPGRDGAELYNKESQANEKNRTV
jgi:hypothetical protein